MKKYSKNILILSIIIAAVSIAVMIWGNITFSSSSEKSYVDFLKDLNDKKISTVYLTNSPKIKVNLKDNTTYETDNPRDASFKETLLKDGVNALEQKPASIIQVIPAMLFVLSAGYIIFFVIKGSNLPSKGLLSVDKLDTEATENTELNFESVAGNEEAKESVKDVVDFLKNPERYSKYGARMPKGIILYGEPGTGKTLIAKAIAGEAGVPFYAMSGSDFVQVYVGVGASRIRQLFKKARSHGKAVIFIDEIDAIGKKRESSKSGGSDERDQTLNALLTEMSGFNEKEGIIVMAATNRLDMLDSALLRPGRFDRHIEITLPDAADREKILNLHMKNKPVMDINLKDWALKTTYFSGAKLENLVNEAAILACKEESEYIKESHLDKAFSIVLAGYEKTNRSNIKIEDRDITAFHEAGHALVSLSVLPNEKVSKITIIPSTKGAGGYTLSIPEDKMYQNKKYLLNRIMVLLGGRAAEELTFGKDKITTGAYSDLKHSTGMITEMITQYGMGDTLGLLTVDGIGEMKAALGKEIFEECKTLIDSLYSEVKNILTERKEDLSAMADLLKEKETIYEKDLEVFKKSGIVA